MTIRKPRQRQNLRFWGLAAAVLLILGGLWLGAFALTDWLAPAWPGSVRGVVALWTSLVLFGTLSVVWGRRAGRRRPDVFGRFNEALRRIAGGDYSVQVPTEDVEDHGPGAAFHQLAANLNAMTSALSRVEELRRQFVADVSHEFQSPLTSILGFAQALQTSDQPESLRQRYLGIIEAEARRLSRVSEQLLRLSTLDDREEVPDPAGFRLDVQLRQALVAAEPRWSAKNLRVEADLDAVEVVGNEGLWAQVWTNLIGNAVKFTPEGGAVWLVLTGTPPVVEVRDSGIGLTGEQQTRVFERFYKAEASRSSGDGTAGSGLGLALVHRIVTLHGASVEVESPGLGRGTVFRVRFPAAPSGPPPPRPTEPGLPQPTARD